MNRTFTFFSIFIIFFAYSAEAELPIMINKETNISLLNHDTALISTKYLVNSSLSGNFLSDCICGDEISNISIYINNENIKANYRIEELEISNNSCFFVQLDHLTKENNMLEVIDIEFITKIDTDNVEKIESRHLLYNIENNESEVFLCKNTNLDNLGKEYLLFLNSFPPLDQPYLMNYNLQINSIKDFFIVPTQIIELNIPGQSEPMDIMKNPTKFKKNVFIEQSNGKTLKFDYYPLLLLSNPNLDAGVFGTNTSTSFEIGMNFKYLKDHENADKSGVVNFSQFSTYGPACIKDIYYKDLEKSDYNIASFEFIPDRSDRIFIIDSINIKFLGPDEVQISTIFHIKPNPIKTVISPSMDICKNDLGSTNFVLFLDSNSQVIIDKPLLNDNMTNLHNFKREWMIYLPSSNTVGTSPSGIVNYFGGRGNIFYFTLSNSSYKLDFKIYNTNESGNEIRHRINILLPYAYVKINPNIKVETCNGYINNYSKLNFIEHTTVDSTKEIIEVPLYFNVSNSYESYEFAGKNKLVLDALSKDTIDIGNPNTGQAGFSVLSFDLNLIKEEYLLTKSIKLYNLSFKNSIIRGDQSYILLDSEFDEEYSDMVTNVKICSSENPSFCSPLKEKMEIPITFNSAGNKKLHFFVFYNDLLIEEIDELIYDSSKSNYPISIKVKKPFIETIEIWVLPLIIVIFGGVIVIVLSKRLIK